MGGTQSQQVMSQQRKRHKKSEKINLWQKSYSVGYRGDCCDDPPLCVCCVPIASCLHLPPIYWSWTHPGNKDQKVPDDPIMHVGQQTFMSSTCAHSLISAAFKTYNTFNIKKLLQRNNFFPSKFIPYSLQYKPNSPKVCILNIIWRLAKISCLKSRQIWVNLQSLRREDSLFSWTSHAPELL